MYGKDLRYGSTVYPVQYTCYWLSVKHITLFCISPSYISFTGTVILPSSLITYRYFGHKEMLLAVKKPF